MFFLQNVYYPNHKRLDFLVLILTLSVPGFVNFKYSYLTIILFLFCSIAQLLGRKEAELETARKEKVAEELIRDEKAKEVMMLELKLKEEQEKVASLQMDVDSAKMESRKQGVLSLEMQNYEVNN